MHAAPLLDLALDPDQAVTRLDRGVLSLIRAVATLYGGSWSDCSEDVRRRRAGRPYLFRLDLTLADELPWLAALETYERSHGQGCLAAAATATISSNVQHV